MSNKEESQLVNVYLPSWTKPPIDTVKFMFSKYSMAWDNLRVTILGTDQYGYRCIKVTKGEASPVYIKVGRTIDVYRDGRKLQ